MTDSTSWQPPTPPESGSGAPASPFGPPVPPTPAFAPPGQNAPSFPPPGQFGPPAAGGVPGAPQGVPGWTPPPKPGLIPLRPLTLGAILGASFQVLRRNPRPTFGFALLVTGIISVVSLVVVGLVTFFAFARTASAVGSDADVIAAGSFALTVLSFAVTAALAVVVTAVLQGIISLEVARGTIGEKLKLGGLWRAAKGRIGALIGWSSLLTGAVVVAFAIVAAILALLFALGGAAGIGIGLLLGFVFGAGAVVAFLWLGTRLAFVPSALMIERLPLRAAVRRSWTLTIGYFWRTLGIQLLVAVILSVVGQIITVPISVLAGFALPLIDPNGSVSGSESMIVVLIVVYVVTLLVTLVFGAISAVVQAATAALLYIDTRMRKEGLDLELTRFVEARQAGDTSVDNPYLLNADRAAAPAPNAASWS